MSRGPLSKGPLCPEHSMKPGASASVFAGSPLERRAASPQGLFSSSLDIKESDGGGVGAGDPKGEGLPGYSVGG